MRIALTQVAMTEGGRMASIELLDQLNSFLRGEMSAVETYQQAILKVPSLAARPELTECLNSHAERVRKLQSLIVEKGGEAADGSGAWGALARLIEGAATVLGERAAVAALEEGEDHGLREYRDHIHKLDPATRRVFDDEIYAEQVETHALLSSLKRRMVHEGESVRP
jgi:hypothetical protein